MQEHRYAFEVAATPEESYGSTGWTRLEELGDGRARIHIRETYHAFDSIARLILERAVHRYIAKDDEPWMKRAIEAGVRAMRTRRNEHR